MLCSVGGDGVDGVLRRRREDFILKISGLCVFLGVIIIVSIDRLGALGEGVRECWMSEGLRCER